MYLLLVALDKHLLNALNVNVMCMEIALVAYGKKYSKHLNNSLYFYFHYAFRSMLLMLPCCSLAAAPLI